MSPRPHDRADVPGLGALAGRVASAFLKGSVRAVTPVVGQGSQNRVFVVTSAGGRRVVVRISDDPRARRVYEKERWCAARAAAAGVPTPDALATGEDGGSRAWQVQTFVDGVNGRDAAPPAKTGLWCEIGRLVRRVHEVPVAGFGEDLDDLTHGRPGETWRRFVGYNIDSLALGDRDPLRRLGVFTGGEAGRLADVFAALGERPFRFGLCHGDVSPRNTLVAGDGTVFLLDWGCAEAHIVPHYELVRLREWQRPGTRALRAFAEGYGLAAEALREIEADLADLAVLKAVDLVRWAVDRRPRVARAYAARARRLVRLRLDGS